MRKRKEENRPYNSEWRIGIQERGENEFPGLFYMLGNNKLGHKHNFISIASHF